MAERFLSVADELVYKTLPSAGWRKSTIITSSTLALNLDSVPSQAISGLRGRTNVRPGNNNETGSVGLELSIKGMEFWLKHALGKFWSNGASPVDTGGATRTSSPGVEGAITILVDATAAGHASVIAGAFIRVGTLASKNTFVRKVVSKVTTSGSESITVDFPIPRTLVESEPIFVVVSPFTHIFIRDALPRGFSIQHHYEDLSLFYSYSGCKINSLTFNVPTTGLASATADIRGSKSAKATSAQTGSTSLTGGEILPYISWEGAVEEDGTPFAKLLNFNSVLNNELNDGVFAIGSRERQSLPEGRGFIDGSIGLLFQDATIADKFRNETQTDLKITFTNSTSSLELFYPKVTYAGGAGDPPLQGAFGDVILDNFPFQATVETATYDTDLQATIVSTEWIV